MAEQISVQDALELLNDALARDRHAVQELFAFRVPCNSDMADHPTIQVGAGGKDGTDFVPPNQFRVGTLGLLNGLFGTIQEGPRKGWGPICANYTDGRLVSFSLTSPSPPEDDADLSTED